jgi:hypothetical protein
MAPWLRGQTEAVTYLEQCPVSLPTVIDKILFNGILLQASNGAFDAVASVYHYCYVFRKQ